MAVSIALHSPGASRHLGPIRDRGLAGRWSDRVLALQGLEDGQATDPAFLATLRDRSERLTLGEGGAKSLLASAEGPRCADSLKLSAGSQGPFCAEPVLVPSGDHQILAFRVVRHASDVTRVRRVAHEFAVSGDEGLNVVLLCQRRLEFRHLRHVSERAKAPDGVRVERPNPFHCAR